jgi:hypothetical protein
VDGEGLHAMTNMWPDDTSMHQMGDWLAELRGDEDAGPRGDGDAEPTGAEDAEPRRVGDAAVPAGGRAGSPGAHRRVPEAARAAPRARAAAHARVRITERAVIGDELRIPIMWCEIGSCIAWHADPAALGEADIRARAIAAGWRVDALGRLACPRCQQMDGEFWATHPVRLRGRDRAATGGPPAAARRQHAADARSRGGPDAIPPAAPPLVPLPAREPQWEPVSYSSHGR